MKQKNNLNQSGRSMVEMLGVLAIIGVLSVGGIASYTTAMNKHKANKILQASLQRALVISSKLQLDKSTQIDNILFEFDNNEITGVTFGTPTKVGENQFKITLIGLSGESDGICKQIKSLITSSSPVQVNLDCTRLLYNNDLSNDFNGKNSNKDGNTCKPEWIGEDCDICKKGMNEQGHCKECLSNSECESNRSINMKTICDSETFLCTQPQFTQGISGVYNNLKEHSDDICPKGYHWAELSDLPFPTVPLTTDDRNSIVITLSDNITSGARYWLTTPWGNGGYTLEPNGTLARWGSYEYRIWPTLCTK